MGKLGLSMPKQIAVNVSKRRHPVEQAESMEPHGCDETELSRSVEAELCDIDEVLEESAACLGEAALVLALEEERQEWLDWRTAYL
ncbi:MAG TPA: hypothetical protein VFH39_00885, partial [Candidatus Saccharimonadales bacterium]|nr:hypothetical protein [Candidatus Saccharimonadales bacterium]